LQSDNFIYKKEYLLMYNQIPMVPVDNLQQKVELFISCRKLKNMDVFSKSDPVCRVYEFSEQAKNWVKIGVTERIDNNLNPDFKNQIQATYSFERHQKIKFEVVDDDGNNEFDMISTVETSMGTIMGGKAQTFTA
jgi:hypothetical protein